MVELDVEARQGDSGGPIFNDRGELAGVLFGAGQGTTLGSFGGRVESFLASLAPDIGQARDRAFAQTDSSPPAVHPVEAAQLAQAQLAEASTPSAAIMVPATLPTQNSVAESRISLEKAKVAAAADAADGKRSPGNGWQTVAAREPASQTPTTAAAPSKVLVTHDRNVLAVIGVVAIVLQLLRAAR
jgi:hypothetical protein